MTSRRVADLLGTAQQTVVWWRHTGRGPAYFKIDNHVLYDREVVEEFARTWTGRKGGGA